MPDGLEVELGGKNALGESRNMPMDKDFDKDGPLKEDTRLLGRVLGDVLLRCGHRWR